MVAVHNSLEGYTELKGTAEHERCIWTETVWYTTFCQLFTVSIADPNCSMMSLLLREPNVTKTENCRRAQFD